MAEGIGHGVRRRRATRRRSRRTRVFAILGGIVLIAVSAAVISVVAGASVGSAWVQGLPKLEDQKARAFGENSVILYPNDKRLATLASSENRQAVPLSRIAPMLRLATVAIEDRRFYEHHGVDYQGIGRAVVKDAQAGAFVEGASTLTQQLVAILYLDKADRSLDRKIKEAWLAQQLEEKWSKDKILQTYLNSVFYGSNAYGVEAAAEIYFDRHASQLTLAQSALIAGLPQLPSRYDPFRNPKAAKARRNEVLDAMLSGTTREGKRMITRAQWRAARRSPLGLHPGKLYGATKDPFFTQFVRSELRDAKIPDAEVVQGGLHIKTTIQPRLQDMAWSAMRTVLPTPGDPLAALVAIRPKTGEIVAMRSSRAFNVDQYDLTTQQQRGPGSTFKPITLATAISQHINPADTFYISGPVDIPLPNQKPYHVETADLGAAGRISVEEGTLRSDNTVYVQLATDLGYQNVVDMARRLGVRKANLQPYASTTLGTQGVSPLEMASVYATLAAGGVYRAPHAVSTVADARGKLVASLQPSPQRVIPDWVASEVTRILGENMREGTGAAEGHLDDDRPQAGKTGTGFDETDAWFCGYTPDLAACVWMGYQKPRTMHDIEGVGTVFGGTLPAKIWHQFMTEALASTPPNDFAPATTAPVWEPFFSPWTARADIPIAPPPDLGITDTPPADTGTGTPPPDPGTPPADTGAATG